MATLLAIESSCDDTSAAVISNGVVLSNVVVTQEDHKQYGGVVPEVASRQHNNNIVLAVEKALEISKIKKSALDAIAVTQGPGLLGSLLVGVSFAKGLALALDKPLIAVHHMHAHILAHFIEDPKPKFPFICLTVSGGHSQLVIVHSPINMEVVGQTIDDAAGEAFDKAGKMFGLTYPAGPIIDKLAQHGEPIHPFAIAQIPDFNFSFSGFKTSVLYYIQKATTKQHDFVEKNLNDLCASVQYTIIKTLEQKLLKLIKKSKINEIAIAGGVAANKGLRNRLTE
ncbi:MAG TPA: tRNA (adenosine(37)-N6)-threonylcarbamoyltransferase complex transferase subunit TsaD, partial [Saprospiraceae bacterium]|nr:tRNA (adenosine(37)-N6)-threonylcarbamoyltransferase complex transferase subunit TsaD [Saprospiraceae bacterium]